MKKLPQILSILVVISVFTFLSIGANSNDQVKMKLQSKESPAQRLWSTSGHADATSESFIHWDEDGEVSASCAKCHSTIGFKDFIADGTVDSPAALGTTVECGVCHTGDDGGPLRTHTSVTFPSGITVENEDFGPEAICMECHQGRYSGPGVDDYIAGRNVADDDTVSSSLSFRNIHYFPAGATQFGTVTKGGYEYSGKTYDARFAHVTGYNGCATCHNPHTLEVKVEACNTCHVGVKDTRFIGMYKDVKNPKNIRYYGSMTDYDGDGDITEGIYWEIPTFQAKLYEAIQSYAKDVLDSPIAYDSHSYPYFFKDTNANGVIDSTETSRYNTFSARLLKAVYNYQFSKKDPGAYAHGGKYMIELLYDSIEDLNTKLTTPVSLSGMHRTDEGHFDGSAEAWRHWDEDGEVRSSCARCHSAEGLAYYLENGTNDVAAEISNGMLCTTCHSSPPAVRTVGAVTFPSGLSYDMGDASNLCITCHQGRASKSSVDTKIAGSSGNYSFTNIHYFPVGAILLGTEVKGAYEYEGKTYTGRRNWPNHNGLFDTCVECHMGTNSPRKYSKPGMMKLAGISANSDHNVHKPNPEDCVYCHGQDVSEPNPGADPTKFKFSGIRPGSTPDYDGDGNKAESLKNEIRALEAALYAQILEYSASIGTPIVYDSHSYPYFFVDTNGNGVRDTGENGRARFDAALLKAAYNYQASLKEPHGYIHNSLYVAQFLVDSIADLGGDVSAYTWR